MLELCVNFDFRYDSVAGLYAIFIVIYFLYIIPLYEHSLFHEVIRSLNQWTARGGTSNVTPSFELLWAKLISSITCAASIHLTSSSVRD